MSHAGTEDKFIKTLFPDNMHRLRVLDIGCGYGATGLYIRTRTYKNGWCHLVGIDPFQEYVSLQRRMNIYDEVYQDYGENLEFLDKEFDIAIAQHTIEHCTKEIGFKLLDNMERMAKRVIICTPNGYTESGPLDNNQDNHHRSGWHSEDFKKRGYHTRIITKNVNSRLLVAFAKLVFWLKRKRWDNEVLVAWKDQ